MGPVAAFGAFATARATSPLTSDSLSEALKIVGDFRRRGDHMTGEAKASLSFVNGLRGFSGRIK